MAWYITSGVGVVLVVLAVLTAWKEHRWLRNAQFVSGTVIELIQVRGSKGGTSYKPRVQFTAHDGSRHEFVRSYSSNPVGFQVGDEVAVAYQVPSYAGRMVTFGQRFGFATILACVGLSTGALGILFLVGRELVPRIYLR